MLKIDFYVQHLVRHQAAGIELNSGETVRFEFPSGDRRSNKAIEHAQIAQLVQEAAPSEVLMTLRSTGRAEFVHSSPSGMDVHVELYAEGPGAWKVRLVPAPAGAAQSSAAGAGRLAMPSAAQIPPAQAPTAQVTSAQVTSAQVTPAQAAQAQSTPAHTAGAQTAAGEIAGGKSAVVSRSNPQVTLSDGEPKINRFLRLMKAIDASDLHMSAEVAPMVRLHGEIQPLEDGPPLSSEELSALVREIMPERNREEFDELWDTDFAHTIEGVSRFRANVFVDRKGVGAVFRQIPFEILTVDQLGIPKRVLDLCWLSKGLVLVTGPTGSGKSTTLATLIDFINQNRTDHIITIEDPVEFVHNNKKCLVNQREVGTHTKTFKNALRAALREDPDIVLVGEMRDLETISIAIETAETGHLVFGTLHTTSAVSTVDRIIDQFPPEQQEQIRVMLSESFRGVIAQVLCKKKGGGRVAGYEIMISNPAVANLIREGKTYQLKSVMQTGRNLGMQTMNDHLLEHVKAGLVDPEEAYIKSNDKISMKDSLKRAGHNIDLKNDM